MADTITVGNDSRNYDTTFNARQCDIADAEKKKAEAKKRERHSAYKNFYQSNIEWCDARIKLIKECPLGAQIYEFLTKNADRLNVVVCTSKVIEERLGYCRASVSKAVKYLKDHKFLDVKKSGTANVYILNSEVVWKSWGTNVEQAEFTAKVIISKSEQEEANVKVRHTNVVETKERQQTEEDDWDGYNDSCLPIEDECPEE